jgi:DNA-directed RNA polymerase subunit RPC12/RpoP
MNTQEKGADMQSTVEMTEIVCPKCGEEFGDWQSLSLPSGRATACPRCGYDLASDPLLYEEGAWALEPGGDEG